MKSLLRFLHTFCGVLLLNCVAAKSWAHAAPRPNILIILADDLGYSDLGCYGGEAHTPSIDRLAAGGLRFRNFHNTARCSTTRMSLLTGLYPQQLMTDPALGTPPARTDNNVFLPDILRAAGYRTCMSGKWHLGKDPDQTPWARGFQHVFAPANLSSGTVDYWNRDAWKLTSQGNEIRVRTYGPGAYDFYSTDAIADYAVDFLSCHFAKQDAAPFLLYLAFNAPHFNIAADKKLIEIAPVGGKSYSDLCAQGWDVVRSNRYDRMRALGVIAPRYPLTPMSDSHNNGNPDVLPVPAWNSLPPDRQADLARRMALHTAMIERVDHNVGRVFDRLKQAGQLDQTLIFLLSDNGACAEGGLFGWARTGLEGAKTANHAPPTGDALAEMGQPARKDNISIGSGWADVGNTPFRFYKQQTHEGGTRTPLIAHWPAGIAHSGRWSDQNGHVIDLMPTILALAGATYPTQHHGHTVLPLEGRSLSNVFNAQPEVSRTLGYEHVGNRGWIDGNWKLVTKNFPSADGSSPADALELYDLAVDPTELHNLASSQPEQMKAMVQAWNEWARRVGVVTERLLTDDGKARKSSGTVSNGTTGRTKKKKTPTRK